MGEEATDAEAASVIDTLRRCQNPAGGFGGGPGQLSHLAPTYAAVNALAILGRDEAIAVVDRPALLQWLLSLRTPDGFFCMHEDGEMDVRGAYCATSVAALLRLPMSPLFDGTAASVARCAVPARHTPRVPARPANQGVRIDRFQSYDGGIAALPGSEAHGGYAFCALAALVILGASELLDIPALTVRAAFFLKGSFRVG